MSTKASGRPGQGAVGQGGKGPTCQRRASHANDELQFTQCGGQLGSFRVDLVMKSRTHLGRLSAP